MRLHALIFASGRGIPLVGIVYDPKVSGFMDYLEQKNYVNLHEVNKDNLLGLAKLSLNVGMNIESAKKLRKYAEMNEIAASELL